MALRAELIYLMIENKIMLHQVTGSILTPFEKALARAETFSTNVTYCVSTQAFMDIISDASLSEEERDNFEKLWITTVSLANQESETVFN